jgi:hypothetical protein
VDSNLEGILYLNEIARIRQYYRRLSPEAAEHATAAATVHALGASRFDLKYSAAPFRMSG